MWSAFWNRCTVLEECKVNIKTSWIYLNFTAISLNVCEIKYISSSLSRRFNWLHVQIPRICLLELNDLIRKNYEVGNLKSCTCFMKILASFISDKYRTAFREFRKMIWSQRTNIEKWPVLTNCNCML